MYSSTDLKLVLAIVNSSERSTCLLSRYRVTRIAVSTFWRLPLPPIDTSTT